MHTSSGATGRYKPNKSAVATGSKPEFTRVILDPAMPLRLLTKSTIKAAVKAVLKATTKAAS